MSGSRWGVGNLISGRIGWGRPRHGLNKGVRWRVEGSFQISHLMDFVVRFVVPVVVRIISTAEKRPLID